MCALKCSMTRTDTRGDCGRGSAEVSLGGDQEQTPDSPAPGCPRLLYLLTPTEGIQAPHPTEQQPGTPCAHRHVCPLECMHLCTGTVCTSLCVPPYMCGSAPAVSTGGPAAGTEALTSRARQPLLLPHGKQPPAEPTSPQSLRSLLPLLCQPLLATNAVTRVVHF